MHQTHTGRRNTPPPSIAPWFVRVNRSLNSYFHTFLVSEAKNGLKAIIVLCIHYLYRVQKCPWSTFKKCLVSSTGTSRGEGGLSWERIPAPVHTTGETLSIFINHLGSTFSKKKIRLPTLQSYLSNIAFVSKMLCFTI